MQSIALVFMHLLQNCLKISIPTELHSTNTHKVIYSQFVDWCFVYLDQCILLSRPSINFFKKTQINKIYRKIQFALWNSYNIPEEPNQNGLKKSEKELWKNEVWTYKIDKWGERDTESMAEVSVKKIWWRMVKSYLWREICLRVRGKLSFKHKLR